MKFAFVPESNFVNKKVYAEDIYLNLMQFRLIFQSAVMN